MIYFKCDYSWGAHPRVMDALVRTNDEHTLGYTMDDYTAKAGALIKKRVGREDADIHLLAGGTICNLLAISSFLRPHEAVISVDSGHICVHETGAIEATGHKIIYFPSADGKLYPEQVESVMIEHTDEHMVKPKMVYITDSTEIGTIYKKAELEALREVCDKWGLYLYLDGARLGAALVSDENDVTLEDLGRLMDCFYIGGNKNGFLFGEAMVILREELKADFRYMIKQKGALFAKGRLLGVQFEEMFKDNLYFDLAKQGNDMANRLRDGIKALGYEFFVDSPTNQIFPILPAPLVEKLEQKYFFSHWTPEKDGMIPVRFVTSWVTTAEEVDALLADLK